jgi:hypothetical protein
VKKQSRKKLLREKLHRIKGLAQLERRREHRARIKAATEGSLPADPASPVTGSK